MDLPDVKIKKILYATDLSDNARLAFAYAVSLANLYGAGLTLLHVLPEIPALLDNSVVGYISAARWEEIKAQNLRDAQETLTGKKIYRRKAVKEVLHQFCKDTGADQKCADLVPDDIVVVRGHPVQQILTTAEDSHCDLIVMGSHGYGALEDAMLGGTARRVLRRAKVPVLLVRLSEDE
jgi:nucleotide-binding universal stress UspA family protein